jgi:hypothetical protein
LLLACACGLLIANLYYAQPLVGLMSASVGMVTSSAGLLVTLPLAGYCVGILIIVPLAGRQTPHGNTPWAHSICCGRWS